ncbi:hypothetical protein OsccyDRAFT_0703 [Leptolyngbyaceae cyanobacterium JSC-12]|nr:hypothetical protein OsccyDRAFT_0703 [Leptolyngbyaceae cyanobacterium JSC-12]
MAKDNRIEQLEFNNLLDNLVLGVEERLAKAVPDTLNILEFLEEEVDLGIELTLQQRTVLKAFYNLPLTEEETSVLEYWNARDTCTWHPDDIYQVLVLEAGRRSGKSSLASIITAYEFYKLCRLACPQEHYGISKNTPISIIVLATTASQGKKTIFKAVVGVIRNTRYFNQLEQQGRLFVGKEEISFEEKLLYIYSGNSQSGAQVGGTVKVLVMDEVARFKDLDGESNALELWSNLGISTTTFGREARRVAISSAWYEGDAIEKLFDASKTDPVALGIRAKSWDMNPIHAARDNPVVASEYIRDPVHAALEFEGIRPAAVDAFLNANEVKAAFKGRSVIKASRYEEEEAGFNLVKLRVEHIEPFNGSTVFHVDPAIGTDTYAAAFGHNEFDEAHRQIVVIDGFLCWEPNHKAQVSITNVQEAILAVNRRRPISKLSADHYNSVETVQRMRQHGIMCDIQYFSNNTQVAMYDLVRMLLHEQRLILPYDSIWTPLALSELCKVQLIKGRKIDHPASGSKDLSDCIAAVCWQLASRVTRDTVAKKGVIKHVNYQSGNSSLQNYQSARDRWFSLKGR